MKNHSTHCKSILNCKIFNLYKTMMCKHYLMHLIQYSTYPALFFYIIYAPVCYYKFLILCTFVIKANLIEIHMDSCTERVSNFKIDPLYTFRLFGTRLIQFALFAMTSNIKHSIKCMVQDTGNSHSHLYNGRWLLR